jgi:hypothetical protein
MWPNSPPRDEETRRIAFRNVPAWAIEAGWEDPDAPEEEVNTDVDAGSDRPTVA